jgi:hypothetical protein
VQGVSNAETDVKSGQSEEAFSGIRREVAYHYSAVDMAYLLVQYREFAHHGTRYEFHLVKIEQQIGVAVLLDQIVEFDSQFHY